MPVQNLANGTVIDANNIKTIGWIKFTNSSTNVPTNAPNGSYILTLTHSSAYRMQLILDRDGDLYTRALNNNVWSQWKKLAFTS